MKLIFFLKLLIIGACLTACSRSESSVDMIIIDLEKNEQISIPYSSFIDSITYIPLETTDVCLIGEVRDIIISDSIIFMLKSERDEILLFSIEGKYLRKLSKIGQGPGEYRAINQMSYNEKRQSLSISSTKIIEYDLYGNLKNEFRIPFDISDLYQFDNGDYLLSRLESVNDPHTLVALVDSTGSLKREIFRRNPEHRIMATNRWELISWDDEVHFISPQIDNILYTYRSDSLRRDLKFKLLPKVSSDYYKNELVSSGEFFRKNYYRTKYRESSNWVDLFFCSQDNTRLLLYNKKSGKYTVSESSNNDMDTRKIIQLCSSSGNNTFTNCVESENEDDNPVIQILHLKQDFVD